MDQHEFLQYAAAALDRLQIPYFVTGSFAGVVYGEQRMTNDVDIVIALDPLKVEEFVAAFPEDVFLVSRDAVLHALKHHFQFNIIRM